METEYEATYINIDKDEIRERLKNSGAVLERSEFLQKRIPFDLSYEKQALHTFARVRDEGDKITMSIKSINGDKIHNQNELCLTVDNFDHAVKFLELLGCNPKSYQESKRELWRLDGVEITIDTWPFLEPFVEVEGRSEEEVKKVSKKIGFDYSEALFCGTDKIYEMKYGISCVKVNNIPKIIFDMENPFIK
ncbi:TPA: hypothetical protein DCX66_03685 [Candidatus Nomurabacteria bacterium]|uniref:CYTH domain-containing protein n=1 Tax=Candidatus Nomurabacteria bacterium GW2011_GWE1_35_16 TaxID=1618761 RepID=A0A0G0EHX8_9BACT|nr:MAG: hypothetical protein UR55_C0001G0011 [Candidatus Nomurabacteria bacterium GW2011_GWF1_34_20]KKP63720.1 MAG: hypothetical protein UR57_C0001G0011 [Candidatus Nomurabacteria bacterium GW2011_GWE2_34_25]KKP66932.1 MAG: hypothetical protein UR64_C0001G0011 [Candidatus Nomurabacteria bacterium GW2011_GWE1_35_16]HAE36757.1 hypothetical protein [Candidatus Nomurabacteria bacterium]HAX65540.1 hypothetical protein [Candidatus Nomurabacteria bacterium]